MEGEKIRAIRWVMKRERWTGSRKEIPGKDTVNPDRHFEEEGERVWEFPILENQMKKKLKNVKNVFLGKRGERTSARPQIKRWLRRSWNPRFAIYIIQRLYNNVTHVTPIQYKHSKIQVVLCDLTQKNPRGTFCLACL